MTDKRQIKLAYEPQNRIETLMSRQQLLSLKVPTRMVRKRAQQILEQAAENGITPYYVKKAAYEALTGTRYE